MATVVEEHSLEVAFLEVGLLAVVAASSRVDHITEATSAAVAFEDRLGLATEVPSLVVPFAVRIAEVVAAGTLAEVSLTQSAHHLGFE